MTQMSCKLCHTPFDVETRDGDGIRTVFCCSDHALEWQEPRTEEEIIAETAGAGMPYDRCQWCRCTLKSGYHEPHCAVRRRRESWLAEKMEVFHAAAEEAKKSPCAKSQRGVVLVHYAMSGTRPIWGCGHNAQPPGFACDGSDVCREHCNKLCVHAESAALRSLSIPSLGLDLFHVKVRDGEVVPSGAPSCWQCSREILAAGIRTVWLLHDRGPRPYTAKHFHELTLEHHGLEGFRK